MTDGVFRYGSVLFCRLLDDGAEVATAAVLHEDVDNSSVYRCICRGIVQCGRDAYMQARGHVGS
jgi:hypothetical protein